jgi:hypothetical protein
METKHEILYQPGLNDHGLPFDPFKACVVPRPVSHASRAAPGSTPLIHTLLYRLDIYGQRGWNTQSGTLFTVYECVTFDPPTVMCESWWHSNACRYILEFSLQSLLIRSLATAVARIQQSTPSGRVNSVGR